MRIRGKGKNQSVSGFYPDTITFLKYYSEPIRPGLSIK
uniref:Uncharacterized protein n=1 Tax=Candidatus Kentrum sp. FW TaxID=2126338 RepID=A0A450RWD0_9GAMM|nr:MAG: hypothetical protein BECKFW1821A_GA0114235_100447 [Candidatus Kentron sp. FW]VFJ63809.1 MAG: hypothetical protein BECKFW1821B_GA0114236_10875 [Candidatus Kentron sp. FW]